MSDISVVPQTREPEPQVIPTMAPQIDSEYFLPFHLPPELAQVLIEDPELRYLVRTESESVGRASTVIDCDE